MRLRYHFKFTFVLEAASEVVGDVVSRLNDSMQAFGFRETLSIRTELPAVQFEYSGSPLTPEHLATVQSMILNKLRLACPLWKIEPAGFDGPEEVPDADERIARPVELPEWLPKNAPKRT